MRSFTRILLLSVVLAFAATGTPLADDVTKNSRGRTGVFADAMCAVLNQCYDLLPTISSYTDGVTPGQWVFVQGQHFNSSDGTLGEMKLILAPFHEVPFERVEWSDTYIKGFLPAYWGPELNNDNAILLIKRKDGRSVTARLPFQAKLAFGILRVQDIVVGQCGGGDGNSCPGNGQLGAVTAWHTTSYGHDAGSDHYSVTLKNQWVFADMEFAVTIARNGTVQAPSGFPSCNAVLSPTTPQPGQMARCSSHADLAVH